MDVWYIDISRIQLISKNRNKHGNGTASEICEWTKGKDSCIFQSHQFQMRQHSISLWPIVFYGSHWFMYISIICMCPRGILFIFCYYFFGKAHSQIVHFRRSQILGKKINKILNGKMDESHASGRNYVFTFRICAVQFSDMKANRLWLLLALFHVRLWF